MSNLQVFSTPLNKSTVSSGLTSTDLNAAVATRMQNASNQPSNGQLLSNDGTTPIWINVPATSSLKSATTTIDVSSSTAPTPGQFLKAQSSNMAAWSDVDLTPYATTTSVDNKLLMKMQIASNSPVNGYVLSTNGTTPTWVSPTTASLPSLGFLSVQSNVAQSVNTSSIVQVAFGNVLSSSFGSRATFVSNVFKNTSGSNMTLLLNVSVKSASDSVSGTSIVWFGVSSMSSNPGQLQVRTLSEEFAISTSSVVSLPNNATIQVLIWQVSGTTRVISQESSNSRAVFTIKELI